MATLQLFFSSSLFLIISFFHPTKASICPASSCPNGPPVRFPFRLRKLQSSRCGYNPGFDLSCNNQTKITTLTLPAYSDNNLIVQSIDYELQTLFVSDPNHCLPKRFLDHTLNLNDTPFHIRNFENYTFLNCSAEALALQMTSFPVEATRILCLSRENHTVFAVPSSEYNYWLESASTSTSPSPSPSSSGILCSVSSSGLLPRAAAHEMDDMFGYINGVNVVGLTWSTPDCRDCEARGRICGFERDTNRIVCSDRTAKGHGLPRSAKYGIIIGVGIPGLLCILGLASYVAGRIKAYGRRHQPSMEYLSASTPQQPAIVIAGLDGPTIESYPKTLLGESRRLPKANDNTCSICLSEYQPKEALRTIPDCNHYFHANCIDEWLKMNATCPMCRKSPDNSVLATSSSSVSSSSTSLVSP